MSVFTTVTPAELNAWLKRYSIGELVELQGIAAGIENTNYFVTTTRSRYVLTLFERMSAGELAFYLDLMAHLARHGIPCAQPIADLDNAYLSTLNGKPAAIVTRLPGRAVETPDAAHCARVGAMLAEMHLAAASYPEGAPNPRGAAWRASVMPQLLPFLEPAAVSLLESEMRFQAGRAAGDAVLPRGVVHADLFRDNVLWDGGRIGGVIDFYFAGVDAWIYDIAIAANDWCLAADGGLDAERVQALLAAYGAVRALTPAERAAWPAMLRAGALRFWMSRLYDLHLPRAGALTHTHDPAHFERLLRRHVAQPAVIAP